MVRSRAAWLVVFGVGLASFQCGGSDKASASSGGSTSSGASATGGGAPSGSGGGGHGGAGGSGAGGGSGGAAPECRTAAEIKAIPGILVADVDVSMSPTALTNALQSAINEARDKQLVLYLPPGDYAVTDVLPNHVALECHQADTPQTNHTDDGRFHPCVIVGSTCDPKTPSQLRLDSSASADAVLLDIYSGQFNETYNNIIRGVRLDTGDRASATAIRFRSAQGSTLQDTIIDLSGSPTGRGLDGGPGSGGSVENLTVIGGAIGIDYSATGEQSTVVGATLRSQTTSAIVYGSDVTFVGVGIRIEDFQGATAIDVTQPTNSTALTLVDSTVDFAGNTSAKRIAVGTKRSTYLENVFVRNATQIIQVTATPAIQAVTPPSGSGWFNVDQAAVTPDFGAYVATDGMTYQPTSHVYVPGPCPVASPCRRFVGSITSVSAPPTNLAGSNFDVTPSVGSSHVWTRQADFEDKASVIVHAGNADDAATIQNAINHAPAGVTVVLASSTGATPTGEYKLKNPVVLHAGTRLVGLAPTTTILEPLGGAGSAYNGATQLPVIDTDVAPTGDTVLAFVGIYNDPGYQTAVTGANAFGVRWRSGPESVFRSPFPNFLNNTVAVTGPLFDVSGGGRFYNVWGAQESLKKNGNYRVYKIHDGTGLRLYEFDVEHAGKTDGTIGIQSEVVNETDVRFYGVKNETGNMIPNAFAMQLEASTDVRIYGHGGNGRPGTAMMLYQVTGSHQVVLANLVEAYDQHDEPLGGYSMLSVDGSPLPDLERPGLYVIP